MINSEDRNRMIAVIKGYGYGLCGAIGLSIVAFGLAYSINTYWVVSKFWGNVVQMIGIILAVAALYGQRGWEIQTWDGDTPGEKLNKILSQVLLSVGYFVAILGYAIGILKNQ